MRSNVNFYIQIGFCKEKKNIIHRVITFDKSCTRVHIIDVISMYYFQLSLPVNFKIWKKKKFPSAWEHSPWKMPGSKGGAEIKKTDIAVEGERREFRRKSLTKELFNLSLHSICARVQCSWNMCVYRTTVSTQSYFCVCIRFGRLSKFDQNCYRLFSPPMRLPFKRDFFSFSPYVNFGHIFSRLILIVTIHWNFVLYFLFFF